MSEYKPTIGLEIHAELKTASKMFCGSKNDPDAAEPNIHVCPICMGHPGTLPVINKEAVKHVLKVGLAMRGTLADYTEFDRKNYFYPDIPKGYQISQYKYPLVQGGTLNGIELTRIHLEEDTAKSTHDQDDSASMQGGYSLIDFNRAGVPLMELVTEPVIHSGEEAASFARELRTLLRFLGASEANMEKGQMRVEANISVSNDPLKLGTKVEVKNLNSFRSVERAIAYEIKRHIELLERGEKIVQETRGWDESKEKTFSQRLKEESHDYRYFPDPDLPKLNIPEIEELSQSRLVEEMPELPWERRVRYQKDFGLSSEATEIFIQDEELGSFFEQVTSHLLSDPKAIKLAANYITSDIIGLMKSSSKSIAISELRPAEFAALIDLVQANTVSSRGAKEILSIWIKEGGNPESIAENKGLLQKSDEGELLIWIEQVIKDNEKVVSEYKAGKEASLQFLIGQVMKLSRGSANPQAVQKLIKSKLQ